MWGKPDAGGPGPAPVDSLHVKADALRGHLDALLLQQRKLNLGREISQASSARQLNRSYAAAAYGRLAPDDQYVAPAINRAMVRHFWPRRIGRMILFLIQVAILGAIVYAGWWAYNHVRT